MKREEDVVNFLKGDDKKAVLLVNVRDSLSEVGEFFRRRARDISGPHLMVFFGMEAPRALTAAGLRTETSEDFLAREDCERIDGYVFGGITKSWYLYKDVTAYRGIHLGKLFEYDLQKYLTPRIKNLEIVKNVLAREKPGKVVVIEDSDELIGAAELHAGLTVTPILKISLRQKEPLFGVKKFRGSLAGFLKNALDRFSYKRLMKKDAENGFVLIDAKLCGYFKESGKISFIPSLTKGGLTARLNLITRISRKDRTIYRKRWKELSSNGDFRSIFEYGGIPVWEMLDRKIGAFFTEVMPRAAANIDMLEKVIQRKKIKIAVLRNDVKEQERTLILALRLHKIPSLVMQHGILAESNGHNILLADKFAAWGRASVEWYGRFGNPSERFAVTGNPRFDILTDWRPRFSRQELCKRLGLDEDKGIVLFATQQVNRFSSFWTEDLFWVMAGKLLEAMRQFPNKQLVIKADPYEDTAPYRERIMAGPYNNAVATKKTDIYTLIYFSELVITQDSTVGLEAMVFDKPLITVNLTKRQDRVPYAEKGGAVGVYKGADLPSAVRQALTDEKTISGLKAGRKEFIRDYAHALDGKARARAAGVLDMMCGTDR
jgi:hypothetical protein